MSTHWQELLEKSGNGPGTTREEGRWLRRRDRQGKARVGKATLSLWSRELGPHCTASGPLLCFWQWAVCKACEQEIKSSG